MGNEYLPLLLLHLFLHFYFTFSNKIFQQNPTFHIDYKNLDSNDFPPSKLQPMVKILQEVSTTPSTILKVFVSPAYECSDFCDGTISKPYNNLMKAMTSGENQAKSNNISEINIYLMKHESSGEFYIDRNDMSNNFKFQEAFRNFYGAIRISPYFCEGNNSTKCFLKGSRPIIYLRVDSYFIIINKRLELTSLVFDGMEIPWADSINQSESQRYSICSGPYLQASLKLGLCNTSNLLNFTNSIKRGNSIFSLQPMINCFSCKDTPTFLITDCYFNNIKSFGNLNSLLFYTSLLSATSLIFEIQINDSIFENLTLYESLFSQFRAPISGRVYFNQTTSLFKFINSSFSNFYLLNNSINSSNANPGIFCQGNGNLNLTIMKSKFSFNNGSLFSLISWIDAEAVFVNLNLSQNLFKSNNIGSFFKLLGSVEKVFSMNDSVFINNSNKILLAKQLNFSLSTCYIELSFIESIVALFEIDTAQLSVEYLVIVNREKKASLIFSQLIVFFITTALTYSDDFIFSTTSKASNVTKEVITFKGCMTLETCFSFFQSNRPVFSLNLEQSQFIYNLNALSSIVMTKAEWQVNISNCSFYFLKVDYIIYIEIARDLNFEHNKVIMSLMFGLIFISNLSMERMYYYYFLSNVLIKNYVIGYIFKNVLVYLNTTIKMIINNNLMKEINGGYNNPNIFRVFISIITLANNTFANSSAKILLIEKFIDQNTTIENVYFNNMEDTLITAFAEGCFKIKNVFVEFNRSSYSPIQAKYGFKFDVEKTLILSVFKALFLNFQTEDGLFCMYNDDINNQIYFEDCIFFSSSSPGIYLELQSSFQYPLYNHISTINYGAHVLNSYFIAFSLKSCMFTFSGLAIINNCFFYDSWAKAGTAIYLNQRTQLFIYNSVVMNCSSQGLGGFLYAYDAAVSMLNIKIKDTFGERGGAIYIEKGQLSILYSNFRGVRSNREGALHFYLSSIDIKSTEFSNCSTKASGGVFWVEESSFTIKWIKVKGANASIKGAAAYFRKNTLIRVKGFILEETSSGLEGNIYLEGRPGKSVEFEQVTCQSCSSIGQGACMSAFDTNIQLRTWKIINSGKQNYNYITILSSSSSEYPKLLAYIEDLYIYNNSFSQSFIVATFVNLTIVKGFAYLMKTSGTQVLIRNYNGVTILEDIIIIIQPDTPCESIFTGTDFDTFFGSNLFLHLGRSCSAFSFEKGESATLVYTTIVKGFSNVGGGAVKAGNLNLILEKCNFIENEAELGGALYIEDSNLWVTGSLFQKNKANEGSDLYDLTTDSDSNAGIHGTDISIVGSSFFNSDISAIYLMSATTFYFHNNNLDHRLYASGDPQETQALKLQNVGNLSILNVGIKNYRGRSAVEITNLARNCTLQILNLTIKSCSSKGSGGAIKIIVTILNGFLQGSFFDKNYAEENGGALLLACLGLNCTFEIKDNLFYKNEALLEGPVAKFDGFLDDILKDNIIIAADSLARSKHMVMSYPFEFRYSLTNNFSDSFSPYFHLFEALASGQSINFTCQLFDTFGQSLELSSDGVVKIIKDKNSLENIIFENNQAYFVNGLANFYDFIVVAQPGHLYLATISYTDRKNQVRLQKTLQLTLRLCKRGEVYSGTICLKCAPTSYSLEPDPINNNKSICDPCPRNAYCPGGDLLLPLPGFWRKNEFQVTVVKCSIGEACPGGFIEDHFSPTCNQGYFGNLCANCDNGYRKSSSGRCTPGVTWLVIFLYAIMLIVSSGLIAYQTVFAFSVTEAECKRRSLFKILVDHFSYLNFISRLDINWSSFVSYLFDISEKFINTVPSEILDFNWILTNKVPKENVFLVNSVMVAVSPLFFWMFSLFFLYLFSLLIKVLHKLKFDIKALHRKDSSSPKSSKMFAFQWRKDLLALFLVIIYNYSPRMIINALQFLKCLKIDDSSAEYLEENPEIACWEGGHKTILFAKVFPSLLLWVVAIPLFLIVFTVKMQRSSSKNRFLKSYSYLHKFLTIDYIETRYYWEGMIYLSKFAIALCFIITSGLDTKSQGAILILLFLFLFLVQDQITPYRYPLINSFKAGSYIVIILTIALTILASIEKLGPFQKNMYLGLLLMLNGIFYCAWIVFFVKQTVGKKFVRIINKIAGSVIRNTLIRPTRTKESSKIIILK